MSPLKRELSVQFFLLAFFLHSSLATDCDALRASFPSANIPEGAACCSGFESILSCDENSRITSISIFEGQNSNFALKGQMSSRLRELTEFQYMRIRSAAISYPILPYFCNMTKLDDLYLVANQISGEIPECLFELPKLTQLNLRDNQLTGNLPNNIGNAIQLQILYLDRNRLNGTLPDSITKLINLWDFQCSGNQISGELPIDIGKMTSLMRFICGGNELQGELPKSLADLSNLLSM